MQSPQKCSLRTTNKMFRRPQNWAAAIAFAGLTIVPLSRADILGFTQGGAGATDFTLNANPNALAAGRPSIVGGELLLTLNANDQAVSAFYNTAQSVLNFTASFTYTMGAASVPPADGFAFILQNAASGRTSLGGGGGALGYLGIQNSVAAAFDIYNGGNGSITRFGASASGYGGFAYQDSTPVSLRTAPVNVSIAFRDGVLTETLTQGASTITRTSNVNVFDRMGANAFVGFSAATGGANADQKISGFTFTTGNAPAVAPAATILSGFPTGGAGVFGIREVQSTTNLGNLNDAQAAIQNAALTSVDYSAPVLNLYDTDTRGRYTGDSFYKLDPDQVTLNTDTVNNVALIATGTIRITTAGVYTFGTNSDDGFRMTIDGRRFEQAFGQGGTSINANGALEFFNGRGGGESSLGTIYLPVGDHKIQFLNWEGGGGANVELYSAFGAQTTFDTAAFSLIGSGTPDKVIRNRVVGVAPWTLKEYTNVNNVNDVLNNGRTNTGTQRGTTSTVPTIRYSDPQGANNGSHGGDATAFPNDTGADDDNYGAYATTTITIDGANAGRYTFMMYSDDDSRFRILLAGVPVPLTSVTVGDQYDSDGVNGNDTFGTGGCCFDQFGHYDLAAGTYTIEAAFHEGGGGSGFFIYATQGDTTVFDTTRFQLLGANADNGTITIDNSRALALVPEPGSVSLLGLVAAGLLGRRTRHRS